MKLKTGSIFYTKAFISIIFITHLSMLIDSSIQQVYGCVIQNVIGCAVSLFLYIFTKKNWSPFFSISLLLTHIELQVFAAIILLGWNLQFQYFYLAIMIFSFFMTFSLKTEKLSVMQKFLGLSSAFLFFLSYFISRKITPYYKLSETVILRISMTNYISLFIGIAFLSNLFRINAFRFAHVLRKQSFRDELTMLYNRRGIRIELDRALDALNDDGIPYSVCIFDIDDFKKVNDTYGHDAGDLVLKEISRVLQSFENNSVTACRWGGEEFLLVRQNSISKDAMTVLANKIAAKISQLKFTSNEGAEFKITITGGCANSDSVHSVNEIIKTADNRLYRGKVTGKNKIVSTDQD